MSITNTGKIEMHIDIKWDRREIKANLGRGTYIAVKNIRENPQLIDSPGVNLQIEAHNEDDILNYSAKSLLIIEEFSDPLPRTQTDESIRKKWINYIEEKSNTIKLIINEVDINTLKDEDLTLQEIGDFFSKKSSSNNDLKNARIIKIHPINLDENKSYKITFDFNQVIIDAQKVSRTLTATKFDKTHIKGGSSDYYKIESRVNEFAGTLKIIGTSNINNAGAGVYLDGGSRLTTSECGGGNYEGNANEQPICIEVRNCSKTSAVTYDFTCRVKTKFNNDLPQNGNC